MLGSYKNHPGCWKIISPLTFFLMLCSANCPNSINYNFYRGCIKLLQPFLVKGKGNEGEILALPSAYNSVKKEILTSQSSLCCFESSPFLALQTFLSAIPVRVFYRSLILPNPPWLPLRVLSHILYENCFSPFLICSHEYTLLLVKLTKL